jgi:uncharacterized Zn finger protein
MNIEELRSEAKKLVQKDEERLVYRSCWECNGAHEHLKKYSHESLIYCFDCGKFWYKETDVTEE